jgi:hypothetical protein
MLNKRDRLSVKSFHFYSLLSAASTVLACLAQRLISHGTSLHRHAANAMNLCFAPSELVGVAETGRAGWRVIATSALEAPAIVAGLDDIAVVS